MNQIMVEISQRRAEELKARGFDIYLSPKVGYLVRVDNVTPEQYQYQIYRTGDKKRSRPKDAFKI